MGKSLHTYKLSGSEQVSLVEENIALVRYTINQFYSYAYNDEDVFQIGCIGLCQAAATYNGKAKFSTYAVSCIKREIANHYRNKMAKKRKADTLTISLEYKPNGVEDVTIEDMLFNDDFTNDLVKSIAVKGALDSMTSQERLVANLKLEGMKISEIGDELGITMGQVAYILEQIKKRIKKALAM